MKHTKGPWFSDMNPDELNPPVYIKRKGGKFPIVGTVFGCEGDSNNNHENAKANANLIAAAPELLEACKWSLRLIKEDRKMYLSQKIIAMNMLMKAINKAEGK